MRTLSPVCARVHKHRVKNTFTGHHRHVMFHYKYDVVVETRRCPLSVRWSYEAHTVHLRLLSPRARRFHNFKFSEEVSACLEEEWQESVEWWSRLVSKQGVPVREYVAQGIGERNKRTSSMLRRFGVQWSVSYIPTEFWRAAALKLTCSAEMSKQQQYLQKVVASRASLSLLKLHAYQKEGVAFVLAMMAMGERGSILGDEMGLGKTLQSLMVVACLSARKPNVRVLVVCPGFLRLNWRMEFEKWSVVEATPQTMKTGKDLPTVEDVGGGAFVIASYEWLTKIMCIHEPKKGGECLRGYDLVIFDEAHFLKSMGGNAAGCSQRNRAATKLLEKVVPKVKHALFLTGTPCPNYAKEMYALLRLTGSLSMKYPEFAFRYCHRYLSSVFQSWDDTGVSAAGEMLTLQTHMLRRLAKDHLELPKEIDVFVHLKNCSSRALKGLEKRRESLKEKLQQDGSMTDEKRRSLASQLKNIRAAQLRECGLSKRKEVVKYLKQYLEDYPGNHATPFIVFAYHKEMFAAIEEMLERLPRRLRVRYAIVNGETPREQRDKAYRDFSNGRIRVYVLSLTMTNGLNMQRADMCVFSEVRWSPGEMRQAQTRICRQGSAHTNVRYVWLFGGEVDVEVHKGLMRKERNMLPAVRSEGNATTTHFHHKRKAEATETSKKKKLCLDL